MFVEMHDFMKKNDPLAVPLKGKVVDNNDPKKLGRLKIQIPGILEDSDFTKLPWIYPKNPVGFGGTPDGSPLTVPTVGAELTVEFPYKEIYAGFYTGYQRSETTRQGMFFEDYPNTYGSRDTQNTYFKVNRSKRYAEFRHTSRMRLLVEREGETTMETKHSMRFVSEDKKTEISLDMINGIIHLSTKNENKVTADIENRTINTVNETIGAKTTKVTGAETKKIIGNQLHTVGGSRSDSIGVNDNVAVVGNKTKFIGFLTTETYGGTKKQTIVAGNKELKILVGNIVYETLAGLINIKNPNSSMLMSSAGQTDQKSNLSHNIKAGQNFTAFAGPLAHIKAATTKLNSGSSPVLTEETDPLIDLITGAPTVGVPTVLAGA